MPKNIGTCKSNFDGHDGIHMRDFRGYECDSFETAPSPKPSAVCKWCARKIKWIKAWKDWPGVWQHVDTSKPNCVETFAEPL